MEVVIHDTFLFPGGGERVALELAQNRKAQLITGAFDQSAFPDGFLKGLKPQSLNAYDRFVLAKLSKTTALWRSFASIGHLSVDHAWLSGQTALLAHGRIHGRKTLYCHTPPRILFDLRSHYLNGISPILRPAYSLFLSAYESAYRKAIGNMDTILANSRTVQKRISHFLGRESTVLHPPCGDGFRWSGQENYYLSTARLDTLKRVELIVEAFVSMPKKKLVVISDGPCAGKIKTLANNAPNIVLEGIVSQERLVALMSKCIASIYIPRDEDFGMSPVESMAAGKPVIGVAEGGVRETVLHEETGMLLPPNTTKGHLISAVSEMTPDVALSMREACEARSERFSSARFADQLARLA